VRGTEFRVRAEGQVAHLEVLSGAVHADGVTPDVVAGQGLRAEGAQRQRAPLLAAPDLRPAGPCRATAAGDQLAGRAGGRPGLARPAVRGRRPPGPAAGQPRGSAAAALARGSRPAGRRLPAAPARHRCAGPGGPGRRAPAAPGGPPGAALHLAAGGRRGQLQRRDHAGLDAQHRRTAGKAADRARRGLPRPGAAAAAADGGRVRGARGRLRERRHLPLARGRGAGRRPGRALRRGQHFELRPPPPARRRPSPSRPATSCCCAGGPTPAWCATSWNGPTAPASTAPRCSASAPTSPAGAAAPGAGRPLPACPRLQCGRCAQPWGQTQRIEQPYPRWLWLLPLPLVPLL
jgi:hypothetical protein